MDNKVTLLQNAFLVLPDTVEKADLLIEGEHIQKIGTKIKPPPKAKVIDLQGQYLLPGFIDIHHHGAKGFDYSMGEYDAEKQSFSLGEQSYRKGVLRSLKYFLSKGATRVLPTSLAAPLPDLVMAFRQLGKLVADEKEPLRHMIGGINVEGSFLKTPEYCGAQSPENFYPPSRDNWNTLQDASGSLIKLVNIPPEHGQPGLDLIADLTAKGVVVSAGHTASEADAMFRAVEAGTRLSVHFFNGPSRSSSKPFHDGGAEEAMLRADEMSLELIVDGYHIHPSCVRDAMTRKGYERIILITDSMFVNGEAQIKQFTLCGIPGAVSDNREYLQVTAKADTLFGSVLTPDRGFENVLNWLTTDMTGIWHRHHPALNLHEALCRTSMMASANPALLLGMHEGDEATGKVKEGMLADLIAADLRGQAGHYKFSPRKVWLRGQAFNL